jgi:hypothetical protein
MNTDTSWVKVSQQKLVVEVEISLIYCIFNV